jgi:hypothetical protein
MVDVQWRGGGLPRAEDESDPRRDVCAITWKQMKWRLEASMYEWEAGDGEEKRCKPDGKAMRHTRQDFPITVDLSKHIIVRLRRRQSWPFGYKCHVAYSGFIRSVPRAHWQAVHLELS